MITKQSKYEVLTPEGWSKFDGIKKTESTLGIYKITTETGRILESTPEHRILTPYGFIEAIHIQNGDVVTTVDGDEEVVFCDYEDYRTEEVFDLIDVELDNEYYTNDIVSHNCQFLGSSGTLISGNKLKELLERKPITENDGIKQYNKPEPDRVYTMICDVSRGKGLDYSAFSVIDVTEMPYKQVCTYRDNMIGPVDYASIIYMIGKLYNEAMILVEINDIGGQVSDLLLLEYGYENLLMTENAGRSGKRISGGFGSNVDRGIRTTKIVKATGCSMLKMMVEQNQILIQDEETIEELKRFSKKGASYEAESGSNDDMVMGLVLFAWLTDQSYFKDMTDINTLSALRERSEKDIEDSLLPFGYINDGLDNAPTSVSTTASALDGFGGW